MSRNMWLLIKADNLPFRVAFSAIKIASLYYFPRTRPGIH